MLPPIKYFTSFLSYKIHSLVAGTHIPKNYIPKRKLIKNIIIKNKKLAKELETECQKNGYLTFRELMYISQFGKYGYYATHKYHGMTDSFLRWPKAIIEICRKEKINHIMEFGCGDGRLALETLKITNKQKINISYTGIEINEEEIRRAKEMLERVNQPHPNPILKGEGNSFDFNIYSDMKDVKFDKPCLLLFSYSLDSIAPDLFVNTTDSMNYPNAMIGVKIENGLISEHLILRPPGRSHGFTVFSLPPSQEDLQLHPWQRVYMPVKAYEILEAYVKKLPKGSIILILDEFTPKPLSWQTEDLCMPQDLEKFDSQRTANDIVNLYKTAGENLLYFPGFLDEYIKILKKSGVKQISFDNEYAGAFKISKGKTFDNPKSRFPCYAILGYN